MTQAMPSGALALPMTSPFVVEAAGGVVWRVVPPPRPPGSDSPTWPHGFDPVRDVEVLLIHRRRRGDWSLPKGKLEPGEPALVAALREVREETGLRCEVGPRIGETRYLDRKQRPKRVRYWAMQEIEGTFRPNVEVDRVRWTPLAEALRKLTASHDVPVVAGLPAALGFVDGALRLG